MHISRTGKSNHTQGLQARSTKQFDQIIQKEKVTTADFSEAMKQKSGTELKFSAHARTRMKSRNIQMTNDMISKLDKAVSGAEKKGSKDTLVLLSDLALIVNIPNKTVITAMDGSREKDAIFTNIDSTVIA